MSNTFFKWRPPKTRFMERFKDRAWRMYGVKVPVSRREEIRARNAHRVEEWRSRRVGGLVGQAISRYKDVFVENITKDFVLYKLLGEKDLEPKLFKLRNQNDPLEKS